ncbi:DNA-3-methyladenine glycosylase family protein [Thermoflexus sp.]|uniref:DNA-3-methyladenine glycosylase family protein n=1 Tax=Thermoflexus sp. TaxID=1969742 RepID=UPI0035E41DF4
MDVQVLTLEPIPPFRLDLTVWALRRRPENEIDRWDGRVYRRTLVIAGRPVAMAVTPLGPPEAPRLQVVLTASELPSGAEEAAARALERLLGLRVDLGPFYRKLEGDPRLGPWIVRFKGLKPPRFPTLFETLVNAIACQQVTLTLGIRLLNRLAAAFGRRVEGAPQAPPAFPQPEDLAGQDPAALQALGFSRQKARSLLALAEAVGSGAVDLEAWERLADAEAMTRLQGLRGIGRWSAEYTLLRGMGRLHIFPGDDVGARNHLQRWLGRRRPFDYEGVRRALAPWQPYAGLVYFHLLLKHLEEQGILGVPTTA